MEIESMVQAVEDAKQCDMCGSGFTPDDRMNFHKRTGTDILESAYRMLVEAQDRIASAECCIAKLIELNKQTRIGDVVPIM